jgi:hypothetical protein
MHAHQVMLPPTNARLMGSPLNSLPIARRVLAVAPCDTMPLASCLAGSAGWWLVCQEGRAVLSPLPLPPLLLLPLGPANSMRGAVPPFLIFMACTIEQNPLGNPQAKRARKRPVSIARSGGSTSYVELQAEVDLTESFKQHDHEEDSRHQSEPLVRDDLGPCRRHDCADAAGRGRSSGHRVRRRPVSPNATCRQRSAQRAQRYHRLGLWHYSGPAGPYMHNVQVAYDWQD